MTTPEAAFVALAAASPGLVALVGDRVWPIARPQATPNPCLVYQTVSNPSEYTHDGRSLLVNPRIQVDCWADDYDTAVAVRDALVAATDGWAGIAAGVRVDVVFVDGDRDDSDPDRDIYRRIVDLRIRCALPTP